MNGGFELAKAGELANIYRLPCGIVNVNIQGVTLHFSQEAFLLFSAMVRSANSSLMDIELKELLERGGAEHG